MHAASRTSARSRPQTYVHKLRLEANEGGNVEISTSAPIPASLRFVLTMLSAVAAACAGLAFYAYV